MYKIVLSFKEKTFVNAADALEFAYSHLHFLPNAIKSDKSFTGGYHDAVREKARVLFLQNNDKYFRLADNIYLYSDERNDALYWEDVNMHVQYFIFSFEEINKSWLNHLITDAHAKGFFMAYHTHSVKPQWQNEIFPDQLHHFGKQGLLPKLKIFWDPKLSPLYKKELIDVFENPGHQQLTYGTWLMAAPEMWFSTAAWERFNKKALSNFTKAEQITESVPDLVFVRLFDPCIEDYDNEQIHLLQKAFRQISGMDNVEKQLDQILWNERQQKSSDQKVDTLTVTMKKKW